MADHELETDPELETIRHQMDQTRTSLADKLDALENKVLTPMQTATDAVQTATDAVAHTVEDVKEVVESVTENVQVAVESVKDTFNVNERVRENPWLMLGGAVTAGFLGGWFLMPRRPEYPPSLQYPQPVAAPREPERTEREDEDDGFAPLKMIKGLAIGTLMGVVREMLTDALPNTLTSNVKTMFDDFTTKLGGQPITSSGNGEASASEEQPSHNGHHDDPVPAVSESASQESERVGRSERRRAGTR